MMAQGQFLAAFIVGGFTGGVGDLEFPCRGGTREAVLRVALQFPSSLASLLRTGSPTNIWQRRCRDGGRMDMAIFSCFDRLAPACTPVRR